MCWHLNNQRKCLNLFELISSKTRFSEWMSSRMTSEREIALLWDKKKSRIEKRYAKKSETKLTNEKIVQKKQKKIVKSEVNRIENLCKTKMSTTKTMLNISPKMSNRVAGDKKELEKYVKMFGSKAVQIIVQSRLGEKIQTQCNARSMPNDWVSERISKHLCDSFILSLPFSACSVTKKLF